MGYTDAKNVEYELRAPQEFSGSTVPSLSAVTTWIEEETAYIDEIAGKSYEEQQFIEYYDYKGEERLPLKYSPLKSVDEFLYSPGDLGTPNYAFTDTKLEDEHFTVYTDKGEIVLLLNNFTPKEGLKKFKITYTTGSTNVPVLFRKLCTKIVAKRVLDTLINNDLNERKSGKTISVGSINIVKPADFGVKQYSQLSKEIENLKSEILFTGGAHRYINY